MKNIGWAMPVMVTVNRPGSVIKLKTHSPLGLFDVFIPGSISETQNHRRMTEHQVLDQWLEGRHLETSAMHVRVHAIDRNNQKLASRPFQLTRALLLQLVHEVAR